MPKAIIIDKKIFLAVLKKHNYCIEHTAKFFNMTKTPVLTLIKNYNIKYNKKKYKTLVRSNLTKNMSREAREKIRQKLMNPSPERRKQLSEYAKRITPENKRRGILKRTKKYKDVTYSNKHLKIRRKYGDADCCELNKHHNCARFEWSNINHKYNNNIKEWIKLCKSCHIYFDNGTIGIEQVKKVIRNR